MFPGKKALTWEKWPSKSPWRSGKGQRIWRDCVKENMDAKALKGEEAQGRVLGRAKIHTGNSRINGNKASKKNKKNGLLCL